MVIHGYVSTIINPYSDKGIEGIQISLFKSDDEANPAVISSNLRLFNF